MLSTPPNPALRQDGDRFWRMPEAYIRGNTIKYLRVPDEVLDKAKEADFRRDGEARWCAADGTLLQSLVRTGWLPVHYIAHLDVVWWS
jgi:hypothetical protein